MKNVFAIASIVTGFIIATLDSAAQTALPAEKNATVTEPNSQPQQNSPQATQHLSDKKAVTNTEPIKSEEESSAKKEAVIHLSSDKNIVADEPKKTPKR